MRRRASWSASRVALRSCHKSLARSRARTSSGLERVVHEAFALLRRLAFFTAAEQKPAQSWHLREGLTAWHAAGEIHSDIQKGFVRAEVVGWQELVQAGGYAQARERGTLRLEGRDYPMADGDVITIRFAP